MEERVKQLESVLDEKNSELTRVCFRHRNYDTSIVFEVNEVASRSRRDSARR